MAVKTSYLAEILGESPDTLLAIREVPHFRDCSEELLKLVYRFGRVFSLKKDQELTRENEFDQWVFFVLSGRLAVTVGGELVDTISSTLVGERCLLGESRKATLRAAEEGITALGVDMSLLDTMPAGEDSPETSVYVELLAIIAAETVHRIAHLSHNQIDIFSKFQSVRRWEAVSTIIGRLAVNDFQADPNINIEIYKFLHRRDKSLLFGCVQSPGNTVDTKKLYARCIDTGAYTLISDLAGAIFPAVMMTDDASEEGQQPTIEWNFGDFSRRMRLALNESLPALEPGQEQEARHGISEQQWRQYFRLDDDLSLDMMGFCGWLKQALKLTGRQVIEALMVVLKEASQYTALINGSIQNTLREMSGSAIISSIEKAAAYPEGELKHYIETTSPEELISHFSRHVLEVHLIKPFLEGLAASPEGASEQDNSGEADAAGQETLADLFD